MAQDGAPLGQPLGPGRRHEILVNHVQHRGPHETRERGGLEQPHDRDGHRPLPQMLRDPRQALGLEGRAVDEGEPPQMQAEEQDEEQPCEKRGQGMADEGEGRGHVVEEGVRLDR